MTSWSLMEGQVERRAGGRSEYGQMHQSLQSATFHVEHVVPRCRGGSSDFDNLAWACPSCNRHKSDLVSAMENVPIGGTLYRVTARGPEPLP